MIAVMKVLLIVFLAISGIMAVRVRRSWNGKPIKIETVSFFVSIRDEHGHRCGGALISLKHVLTAAHCVLDEQLEPVSNLSVISRANHRSAKGTSHVIRSIMYPPTFRQEDRFHDVAVLLLFKMIRFGLLKTIEVSTVEPPYMEVATFFAFDHRPDRCRKHRLHESKFLVLPLEQCPLYHSYEDFLRSDMFCGEHENGEKLDSTDLGGPIVWNEKIIGVASSINRRSYDLHPYYKAVNIFAGFINEARECSGLTCASPTCAVRIYKWK